MPRTTAAIRQTNVTLFRTANRLSRATTANASPSQDFATVMNAHMAGEGDGLIH